MNRVKRYWLATFILSGLTFVAFTVFSQPTYYVEAGSHVQLRYKDVKKSEQVFALQGLFVIFLAFLNIGSNHARLLRFLAEILIQY